MSKENDIIARLESAASEADDRPIAEIEAPLRRRRAQGPEDAPAVRPNTHS